MMSALDTCLSLSRSRTIRWISLPLLAAPLLVFMAGSLCAQTNALPVEVAVMPAQIAAGSAISFSPDDKFLAYTVGRSHSAATHIVAKGVPWFARAADIHVIDLSTNRDETITGGV